MGSGKLLANMTCVDQVPRTLPKIEETVNENEIASFVFYGFCSQLKNQVMDLDALENGTRCSLSLI